MGENMITIKEIYGYAWGEYCNITYLHNDFDFDFEIYLN